MASTDTQSEINDATQHRRWTLAVVLCSLVALAGLVIALQQFIGKFLWDESAHTRTIGGVLFMSLGILGICIPIFLVRTKNRFVAWSRTSQWIVVFGIPVAYVIVMGACIEASLRSTNVILPRPFTPTAVVYFDISKSEHRTDIRFRNALRSDHLLGGVGHHENNNDVERFTAHIEEGFIRHPSLRTGTLNVSCRTLGDGRVEISIDVETTELLRFSVEGLSDFRVTRDGDTITETNAATGKYGIVITGHPN